MKNAAAAYRTAMKLKKDGFSKKDLERTALALLEAKVSAPLPPKRGAPRRQPDRAERTRFSAPMTQGVAYKSSPTPVSGVDEGSVTLDLRVSDDFRMLLYHNPAMWLNTRLATLARLYTRYHFDYIKITYNPVLPSTTAGTITFGSLVFGSSVLEANLDEELRVSPGGVTSSVWAPVEYSVPKEILEGWHNVKFEANTYSLGGFIAAHTSNLASSNVAVGSVTIDYRCRLRLKTAGRSTQCTYLSTTDTTLASGVCTQAGIKDLNVGAIGVVMGQADAGDLGVSAGDLVYVNTKVSGTSVTVGPLRQGLPLGESMTVTALPIQWYNWERDGTD